MEKEELDKKLKELNISLSDAVDMIYNRTGCYIQPRHIDTRFKRYRTLSKPHTIVFKFLFRELNNGKI